MMYSKQGRIQMKARKGITILEAMIVLTIIAIIGVLMYRGITAQNENKQQENKSQSELREKIIWVDGREETVCLGAHEYWYILHAGRKFSTLAIKLTDDGKPVKCKVEKEQND